MLCWIMSTPTQRQLQGSVGVHTDTHTLQTKWNNSSPNSPVHHYIPKYKEHWGVTSERRPSFRQKTLVISVRNVFQWNLPYISGQINKADRVIYRRAFASAVIDSSSRISIAKLGRLLEKANTTHTLQLGELDRGYGHIAPTLDLAHPLSDGASTVPLAVHGAFIAGCSLQGGAFIHSAYFVLSMYLNIIHVYLLILR